MISGEFGPNGELLFEINLMATNGEIFSVEVLLDTGFTTGWLAINSQDLEILDWPLVQPGRFMQTARGEESFDIYAGKVVIDGQEFSIPVVAGTELPDNLLGLQWLITKRLVVDFSVGILTMG
jgi:predicted aspartyl protease